MHHSAVDESIFTQPFGCMNQIPNGTDVTTQFIHTTMENGTTHFYHVGISWNHTINRDRIAISQRKVAPIELTHSMNRILCSILACHADTLFVGIPCETACITKQCGKSLIPLHLIKHRTFHFTTHFHQCIVCTDHHNVIVVQSHITTCIAIQDVVIHVNRGNGTPLAINLNVTQSADTTDTTGSIQGIKRRTKTTNRVSPRHSNLTQHLHLNSASLPHTEVESAVSITRSEFILQSTLSLSHSHTSKIYRPNTLHHYRPIRRNRSINRQLTRPPNINIHLITRTKMVVSRSSHIARRLKREILVVENIAPEHLTLSTLHVLYPII